MNYDLNKHLLHDDSKCFISQNISMHKSWYNINTLARHLRRSLGSVLGLKSRYPTQMLEQFLSFDKNNEYGDQILMTLHK